MDDVTARTGYISERVSVGDDLSQGEIRPEQSHVDAVTAMVPATAAPNVEVKFRGSVQISESA